MENEQKDNKELIDQITEKFVEVLGRNRPIRELRKSQIASAVLGAVGFALFIDGVIKIFSDFPALASLTLGFLLMLTTGLLLKNLYR